MDEAYSESDVSFSPSQILERLQVLRQLQLMQRGKLQKHRLQFQETDTSSSITEIVSQFTSSTSYNTFRSLLQSSSDNSNEVTPRLKSSGTLSQNVHGQDLIDGVSPLNLSQESEFVVSPSISSRSRNSAASNLLENGRDFQAQKSPGNNHSNGTKELMKKQICVDEMPILSPRKDFEQMLLEKLKNDNSVPKTKMDKAISKANSKKPFLKKGEGIARFGLKKNAIVIQNTKSLPWKKKTLQKSCTQSPLKQAINNIKNEVRNPLNSKLQPLVTDFKVPAIIKKKVSDQVQSEKEIQKDVQHFKENIAPNKSENLYTTSESSSNRQVENKVTTCKGGIAKSKHPLSTNRGKTWAAVLTKEQSEFLKQLKQSDYYKNFSSPTKSVVSDVSCDETMCKLKQEREMAEQNLFDLLENKVSHDSFNLENSFFNRFLKKNNLEYSGESTPLVLQKCLSDNPGLMHIFPDMKHKKQIEDHSDVETCSNFTDCCSENSCSSGSCCSCNTVEQTTNLEQNSIKILRKEKQNSQNEKNNDKEVDNNKNKDLSVSEDINKANIAEMNAKLIATSELLKERLNELEDEIETFKKENANLAKLRSEFDQDRQKFYEDKAAFEQKINEEKVLNEYYLAEEKDKLAKQKQLYDRYVREMRGRLNKKDKDEVVNLKTEINNLKEEIRIKDVKSTSTIARLRNQIKLIEKEKKELMEEVEKLKKENKRMQHNNEVTRRLTNIKYLEEINKKLNNMSTKDTRSEVHIDKDIKYKSYEIEKQCRSRKNESKQDLKPLQRAKSVPNLNVTSRYAKYFSQRDTLSEIEQNNIITVERASNDNDYLDNDEFISNKSLENSLSSDNDDYLEKIYTERFKTNSPKSNRSSGSSLNTDNNFIDEPHLNENAKDFFIQKPMRNSKSPKRLSPNFMTDTNVRNKSPVSILSNKSGITLSTNSNSTNSVRRSQSPLSAFNHSSLRSATVIHNQYTDKLASVSPEPVSRTSLTKAHLNPTEFRKSDGSRELRFPNGNVKYISADGKYNKFVYYNGDVKENFYDEGRIKYFYAETKTYHTTHADGLEVLEFPDGQVEKRYKDGSSEIRLPNGSVRYFDPKNKHVREEWRFPDGAALTVAANGDRRIVLTNGQVEVHAQDHKRREFPDGTVKLVYNDGTSETRYASGRVRIKDKHGNLIMDSAPG